MLKIDDILYILYVLLMAYGDRGTIQATVAVPPVAGILDRRSAKLLGLGSTVDGCEILHQVIGGLSIVETHRKP